MKKLVFLIGLLLASYLTQAQNVCGYWSGLLTLNDREIIVVFNVTKQGDVYTSTMDSPSQKVKGFSTTSTTFVDSILTISMDNANMHYQGRWLKNNQMKGVFTQMGKLYALDMTNNQINQTINAKKEIKVRNYYAYSYSFDTVMLVNSFNSEKTKVVYYQPIKKRKISAVVLMCDSKNINVTNNQTYQKELTELAEHLCTNGFAVICINTADADGLRNEAINHLKSNSEINANKISIVKFNENNIQGTFTYKKNNKQLYKEISKIKTEKDASFNELTHWLLKIV